MRESDISRLKPRAAVLTAARLLYAARVKNYPVDEMRLLSAFKRRVFLVPYSRLDAGALEWAKSKSPDGFCVEIKRALTGGGADEGDVSDDRIWQIYYEDGADKARMRFTLMHELGHALLNHHSIADAEEGAQYPDKRADAEADVFAASVLAPAPAVEKLLALHGYILRGGHIAFARPDAPLLKNLGQTPKAAPLVSVAFGLSVSAAERRVKALASELEMWKNADRALYYHAQDLPHRAGWHCWVCGTKRRGASVYCPGCGKGGDYVFSDPGRIAREVIGLRSTGRFEFCSVCGNADYPDGADFCPVCASPLTNPCENARHTPGDFIRSGMPVVTGTHFCRPTDIYCPDCGVLTLFGARHGPVNGLWLKGRCRTKSADYAVTENVKALPFDAVNTCGAHVCQKNYRYCAACGKPTTFFKHGALIPYAETRAYTELIESEKYRPAPPPRLDAFLTTERAQNTD